ncbi:Helicase POLQ-like 2, partial [Homarus americanus]
MSRRVTTRDDIVAVIALYKVNHVLREISAQTGVALRVVQNVVKHFRDLGEDKLPAPLPKSGRPKLLSPRTLKVISRQVRSNPSLTAREVKERNPRLLSHVLLRCVQQALHDDLGFKSFRARRKPLLTKRQKENRVKFCKKYEVWDLETWRSVLWSDKATFSYSNEQKKIDVDMVGGLVGEVIPDHSCLVFCPTRRNCETLAELICKVLPTQLKQVKNREKVSLYRALVEEGGGSVCPVLRKTLPYGVAYHHS